MTENNPGLLKAKTDRNARLEQIRDWTVEQAKRKAAEQDIVLEQEHFDVIRFLQKTYIDEGWDMPVHILSKSLDENFSNIGGLKRMHELFPEGPISQGADLAGLPAPAYAQDRGFGSAQ